MSVESRFYAYANPNGVEEMQNATLKKWDLNAVPTHHNFSSSSKSI